MNRSATRGFAGVGVLAVIAVTAVASAMSARPNDANCDGMPPRLERAIDAMQLDAATRSEVEAVFENARTEKEAMRDEVREARTALRELLAEEEPQEEAVLAQADVIAALESQRHRHRAETMLAVRQLVGQEAWAEFQARRGKPHHRDR